MRKIVDITDKLSFEECPQMQIKDITVTVNDKAVIALEILPLLETTNVKEISKIIFNADDNEKIEKLDLNFEDYKRLIDLAIRLIFDNMEDDSGETQTPATT